jgi:hypothetical protein
MPPKYINATYYNLINNTILNPINIDKYLINITNTDDKLPNIIYLENHKYNRYDEYDNGVIFGGCGSGNTIHIYSLYNDKKDAYTQLFSNHLRVSSKFIMFYLQKLREHDIITWQDYLLLTRLMKNNTHKIRDLLNNLISNAYFMNNP